MGLKGILTVVAAAVLAVVLFCGWSVYALTARDSETYRRQMLDAKARDTVERITTHVQWVDKTLERLAGDPELAAMLNAGDVLRLSSEAERLTALVPGGLKIRLLPGTQLAPDAVEGPQLGFADLDMARQAFQSDTVTPMVHGFGSEDSHLAAARRVVYGDRALGVILLNLSTEFLAQAVAVGAVPGGAVELTQGQLSLGFRGDQAAKGNVPNRELPVTGTAWKLKIWDPADELGHDSLLLTALIVASSCLLVVAFFFAAGRVLARELETDFNILARMATDLLAGKVGRNYPVKLGESKALVSKLLKLKASEAFAQAPAGKATPVDYEEVRARLEKDVPASAPFQATDKATEQAEPAQRQRVPDVIFRAYDIRGIAGESLNREIVYNLGRALGSEAQDSGDSAVVVGRDGRTSSPELAQALIKGIRESGRDVVDIGMVPTPVLYFATHHLNTRSGVMVTGSHNPPEYNGLKMVIGGETLAGDRIQRLRQRTESGVFHKGIGKLEARRLTADYIGAVMEDIQIGRPMKIVIDCGNGVAGELAPVLFKTLGCEVVPLYCDVDGTFPNHHPDPSKPENLTALIDAVKEQEADLGIALDGDGDRLGVIDSAGRIIWPDRQMMVFAADVLARAPGADIVYDVKCSRHLPGEILKRGGRPIMWKTGHSLMKAKIKETGAKLAGEMSGHIFFNDRWYGFDDALYSAARLIEIISAGTRSSSEVFGDLPDSFNTPELTVALEEGENFRFIQELQAAADFKDAKTTTIDGLRVDFSDGWGLVRASNTTPSLVIRFEADTAEALQRIQAQFRKLMKKVNPDIVLPF